MKYIIAMSLLAITNLNCGNSAPEPESRSTDKSLADTTASSQEPYFHVSTSTSAGELSRRFKFPLGGAASQQLRGRSVLHSGESAAISVSAPFNEVHGWTSNSAPAVSRGWPQSVEQHDAMARDYVKSIGIPDSELGRVFHFTGTDGSEANGRPETRVEKPAGFSTSFERVVDGFHVVDSHAGVQLNVDGVPVALSISWPAVPDGITESAKALTRLGANTVLAAAQRSSPELHLESKRVLGSEVVIRHSLAGASSPRWYAALRVEIGTSLTMHSFVDLATDGRVVDIVEVNDGAKPSLKPAQ